MRLGIRLLFAFFLINGIAAFFVLRVFMAEIKPSVREVMEDMMVDTANLLAEVASDDLASGQLARDASQSRFAQRVRHYATRPIDAGIWGFSKQSLDFRVYVTDHQGRVLFDSENHAVGADYSQWRDVARTLRGHVHHRRLGVVRHLTTGTGAVLATQGQVDIVPARIILAHRLAAGVQQDLAGGIGDVDAVIDRELAHLADLRLRLTLAVGLKQALPAVLLQAPGAQVGTQQLGQQVGGVHQGFFGGLAHARTNLVHHRAQDKPAGQADEEEIHQEDANP